MTTTRPPIGAKVRAIRSLNGTTVTSVGVITEAYGAGYSVEPDARPTIVLAGNEHVRLADTPVQEGIWTVTVEILSQPEPANGTWVTTPNREPGRPPYVFHRDDDAVLEGHPTLAQAGYRWYFHEDGDWNTWTEVQKNGAFTVIKDGAA